MTTLAQILAGEVVSLEAAATCYGRNEHGGNTVMVGPGSMFPYHIPEGFDFYTSHIHVACKWQVEPPINDHMLTALPSWNRPLYVFVGGITVVSWHPEVTFNPPFKYRWGDVMNCAVHSGMFYAQNVNVLVQGFLVPKEINE